MTSWPCQALLSMEFSRQEYWNGMELLFSHIAVPDSLDPMDCSTPGFPVLHHLPEFIQTHVHWVGDASNHLILCHHPLLLLPSIFPSIRVFSSELILRIRWLKYWSFSFSISPSMNIQDWFPSGLTDWFDLLAVRGTLRCLLQHHSSKASILWHSAFPGGSESRESACNVGDLGLIPGSGRSPGEGNGSPFPYSCLENSMDRGAWWATVQGAAKSWTWLSDYIFFSAFFMVQLSHLYRTTGKTIALTICTFVSKVMFLLFIYNMLSKFVIAFLLRNKRLLISWL